MFQAESNCLFSIWVTHVSASVCSSKLTLRRPRASDSKIFQTSLVLSDASFFALHSHLDTGMLAPGACVRGARCPQLQHHEPLVDGLFPQWPVGTASGLRDCVRFTGLGISGLNGEGNFGTLPCFKLVVEIRGVALVDKEVGDGVASQLAHERDEVTTNAAGGHRNGPPNPNIGMDLTPKMLTDNT